MISKENFVVTIGNYGAVVALHGTNEIISKTFIEELNDQTKEELKKLFSKNKSAETYILFDTIDQSYKKKIYPSLSKTDLKRVVLRDMNSDPDKDSIKNYMILNPKKTGSNHRWECLFITSHKSEVINSWVDFLLEMQNHIAGIYMLPIESIALFNRIKPHLKSTTSTTKKHDVYCMIVQNKISGTRQIVFSETGMIFTRVVNYDPSQPDFLEKYERDIYGTLEYLKRMFPEITISEFEIINILPQNILDIIKNSTNLEIKYHNYTPFQAASEIGCTNLATQDEQFCDLLVSNLFSRDKKVLKFTLPKITILSRLYLTLKLSYYSNLTLAALIFLAFIYTIFSQTRNNDLIETATTDKLSATQELTRIKSSTLNGEILTENGKAIDIETVMDFGKIETSFQAIGIDLIGFYSKLLFFNKFNVVLTEFSYFMEKIDPKNPQPHTTYSVKIGGNILNKSGDIDDLFKNFDLLVAEAKKTYEGNKIEYTELPRNIDFSEKYYQFPINFTISNN